MTGTQVGEFLDDYAAKFDLKGDILLQSTVKKVTRNADDTKWLVEYERRGSAETREFDKIAFCHGYQTRASRPTFKGQEKFEGIIMHSQEYRK